MIPRAPSPRGDFCSASADFFSAFADFPLSPHVPEGLSMDDFCVEARRLLMGLCSIEEAQGSVKRRIAIAARRAGFSEKRARGFWYGEAATVSAEEFRLLEQAAALLDDLVKNKLDIYKDMIN